VVRRLAVVIIVGAGLAIPAANAHATARPGAIAWTLNHYVGHQIEGLDTMPDGRIVVAGMSVYEVGMERHYTWVHVYRRGGERILEVSRGGSSGPAAQCRWQPGSHLWRRRLDRA
jgi:hypothetical protein